MDPVTILGAVGSVVGIAAFGLKIAQFLDDFIGEYSDAAENFIAVLEGVQSTADALDQVREFLQAEEKTVREGKAPQLFSLKALKQVKTTSDKCLKVFWRIEAVILKKTPTDEEIKVRLEKFHRGVKENKQPDFLQLDKGLKFKRIDRWKWSFNVKDKLEKYNRQLDRQQYTLILMFQVISLNINLTKPNLNAPHKIHYLYEQIPQTALQSGIPEARRRRQSSYMYQQGVLNPYSSRWQTELPDYYSTPRVPPRRNSRYRPTHVEPVDIPPIRRRPRSLSSSPDRGRQKPGSSKPNLRRRRSLSGDEMEEARKLSDEEKNQSSGEEGSVAERLRKKIVALEAIIAKDRKIAGRKDSNVVETKTSEAVLDAKTGEPLIRPRFTQSPTRMDEDELDSILPQRGSYRGSVIPEKKENDRSKRPVRYQKPSVTDQPVDTPPEEKDNTPENVNAQPMVFDFDMTETMSPRLASSHASSLVPDGNKKAGQKLGSKVVLSDQKAVETTESLGTNTNTSKPSIPKEDDNISVHSEISYASVWSSDDLHGSKEPIVMGWKSGEVPMDVSKETASTFTIRNSTTAIHKGVVSRDLPTTISSSTTNVPTNAEKIDLSAMPIADDLSDAHSFTESDYAYCWGSSKIKTGKQGEYPISSRDSASAKLDSATAPVPSSFESKNKLGTNSTLDSPNGQARVVVRKDELSSQEKSPSLREGKEKGNVKHISINPVPRKQVLRSNEEEIHSSDHQIGEDVPHSKEGSIEATEFDHESRNSKFIDKLQSYSSSSTRINIDDFRDGSLRHENSIAASTNGSKLENDRNASQDNSSFGNRGVPSDVAMAGQKKSSAIDDFLQNGVLPQRKSVAGSIINDWDFDIIGTESKKNTVEQQGRTAHPSRMEPGKPVKETTFPQTMALILHPDFSSTKPVWTEQPYPPSAYHGNVSSITQSIQGEIEGKFIQERYTSVFDDNEDSSSINWQFARRKRDMQPSGLVTDPMFGALSAEEIGKSIPTNSEKATPLPFEFSSADMLPKLKKTPKRKIASLPNRKGRIGDGSKENQEEIVANEDMDVSSPESKSATQKTTSLSNTQENKSHRIAEISDEPDVIDIEESSIPESKTRELSKRKTTRPSQRAGRIAERVIPQSLPLPASHVVDEGVKTINSRLKQQTKEKQDSAASSIVATVVSRKPWYKRASVKNSKSRTNDSSGLDVDAGRPYAGSGSVISSDIDRPPKRSGLIRALVGLTTKKHQVYRGFISAFVIRDGEYHQIPHNGRFDDYKTSMIPRDGSTDWWKEYAFLTPKDLAALKVILEEGKDYKKTLIHLKHLQKAKFQFWSSTDQVLIAVVSNEIHSWYGSDSADEQDVHLEKSQTPRDNERQLKIQATKDITSGGKESEEKAESNDQLTYEKRRLYLAYTIRVLFQNTHGDVASVKPTCQKEYFSDSDILERVTNLNTTGPGIIQKKLSLMAFHEEEIEKLLELLARKQEQPDFYAWTLAQLEDHDGPGQGRWSITVYLKKVSLQPQMHNQEKASEVNVPSPEQTKANPGKRVPPFWVTRPTVKFEDSPEKSKATGSRGTVREDEQSQNPSRIRSEIPRRESLDEFDIRLERERENRERRFDDEIRRRPAIPVPPPRRSVSDFVERPQDGRSMSGHLPRVDADPFDRDFNAQSPPFGSPKYYPESYHRPITRPRYSEYSYYDDVPNAPEAPYINREPIGASLRDAEIRPRSSVAPVPPVNTYLVPAGESHERRRSGSPPAIVSYGRPREYDVPRYEEDFRVMPPPARGRPVIVDERPSRPAIAVNGSSRIDYGVPPIKGILREPRARYPEYYDASSYNPFDLNAVEEESGNNLVQKLLKDWTPAGEKQSEDVKGKGKEKSSEDADHTNPDEKVDDKKEDVSEDDDEEDSDDDSDDDWDEMNGYGGVRLTDTRPMSGAGRELTRRQSYSSRQYLQPRSSYAPTAYAPTEPYSYYPPPPPPPPINNRNRSQPITMEVPRPRIPSPVIFAHQRARDGNPTSTDPAATTAIPEIREREVITYSRPPVITRERVRRRSPSLPRPEYREFDFITPRVRPRSPSPIRVRERIVERERSPSPSVRYPHRARTRERERSHSPMVERERTPSPLIIRERVYQDAIEPTRREERDRAVKAGVDRKLESVAPSMNQRTRSWVPARQTDHDIREAQLEQERLIARRKEFDAREKRFNKAAADEDGFEKRAYEKEVTRFNTDLRLANENGDVERARHLNSRIASLHREELERQNREVELKRAQRRRERYEADLQLEQNRRERPLFFDDIENGGDARYEEAAERDDRLRARQRSHSPRISIPPAPDFASMRGERGLEWQRRVERLSRQREEEELLRLKERREADELERRRELARRAREYRDPGW